MIANTITRMALLTQMGHMASRFKRSHAELTSAYGRLKPPYG
jgi:hypothetical protein